MMANLKNEYQTMRALLKSCIYSVISQHVEKINRPRLAAKLERCVYPVTQMIHGQRPQHLALENSAAENIS